MKSQLITNKINFSLLLLTLIIIVMPFSLAATDTPIADDTFKVNIPINYAKSCINNGTYCSASAICNYTFFRSDNTIQVLNQEATNKISYHNYSIIFDTIGLYTINQVCDDGGFSGSETYYAQINPTGFNTNWIMSIIILLLAGCLLLLGFSLKDAYIVIFGSMILTLAGLYTLLFGIDGVRDIYTTSTAIVMLGVGSYISIKSAHETIID